MRRRKTETGTCPYCLAQNIRLTTEHVLPRGFFTIADRAKMKPILIDACNDCNSKKAKEDEWMRLQLVTAGYGKTNSANSVMHVEIRKSVPHARNMLKRHLANMRVVDQPSGDTSTSSKATILSILPPDQSRTEAYIETLAKGLYAATLGIPLKQGKRISVLWASDPEHRIQKDFEPLHEEISKKRLEKRKRPRLHMGNHDGLRRNRSMRDVVDLLSSPAFCLLHRPGIGPRRSRSPSRIRRKTQGQSQRIQT